MARLTTAQMLDQLRTIKTCREGVLRHRARRIEADMRECRQQSDTHKAEQADLRAQWRAANQTEQAVDPRDFHKVKRQFAEFYQREQQLQAALRKLAEQIADCRAQAAQTARALKENLRGQEKLAALMEEQR
ncbi:hypothetical protein KZ686_22635 [Cupriavidus cauae]|jgi:hypothetical protein|uniref:hypothetical protein n=1 Tax=Cupriavidus TaxID=106589 RepID=UPI001CF33C69|nr:MULTISPECIES: hypothetical protein [Cupriavidus]MCA7082871.1 hypothetical protein [Cupriavidus sp. DB3]UZN51141.1 hypothetical protein KZ686_22635 [Cupriavidus cauae]